MISLPRGAEIKHIEIEGGLLIIWASVDPNEKVMIDRRLVLLLSNQDFLEDMEPYFTTIRQGRGPAPYVWHIFVQRCEGAVPLK